MRVFVESKLAAELRATTGGTDFGCWDMVVCLCTRSRGGGCCETRLWVWKVFGEGDTVEAGDGVEDTAGLLEPHSLKCCWSIELFWNTEYRKSSEIVVEIAKDEFFDASSTLLSTAKPGLLRAANSILRHY